MVIILYKSSKPRKSTLLPFNPFPDSKILGLPKFKAFADDKLNVTQNVQVVFHRTGNSMGKEENAGYQHFFLFPQCCRKGFSSGVSKVKSLSGKELKGICSLNDQSCQSRRNA